MPLMSLMSMGGHSMSGLTRVDDYSACGLMSIRAIRRPSIAATVSVRSSHITESPASADWQSPVTQ